MHYDVTDLKFNHTNDPKCQIILPESKENNTISLVHMVDYIYMPMFMLQRGGI